METEKKKEAPASTPPKKRRDWKTTIIGWLIGLGLVLAWVVALGLAYM